MPSLAVVVVLGLASMRLTRLVVSDTITLPFRERLYRWAWDDEHPTIRDGVAWPTPRGGLRTWIHDGLTCSWCFGVYVTVAVYCAWRWGGGVARGIIAVAAIAGVQGALAVWSTKDDE